MSNTKNTTLTVEGMTCSNCVRHVEGALRELEGVGKVTVELATGEVRVEHDPARATVDQMVAAIVEAGYETRGAA